MIDEAKLVDLLKRNLDRMKLLNGGDEHCVHGAGHSLCANHSLIHETEKAISELR